MRSVALDVHLDFCEVAIVEDGELRSAGRIETKPENIELFAGSLGPDDRVALEVTGNAWEIARLIEPHVAQILVVSPSDTGIRQARAKTDRLDARTLARLLAAGSLDGVATLSHHGISGAPAERRSGAGREFFKELEPPVDARERIAIALAMVDSLDGQLRPLESELRALARRQTGCRALMGQFGMGELTALMTLTELGDVQRLSASRKAVRMAGIDIGVHRSDRRSRVGKLNRQGSPHLRWALYEAALSATRPKSPDHEDYLALKARGLTRTRASITIARGLARRSFHILRELGPAALDPITTT